MVGDLKASRVTKPKRGKWKIFKAESLKDEDIKREYEKKAFDFIPRKILWCCLEDKYGVRANLILVSVQ